MESVKLVPSDGSVQRGPNSIVDDGTLVDVVDEIEISNEPVESDDVDGVSVSSSFWNVPIVDDGDKFRV